MNIVCIISYLALLFVLGHPGSYRGGVVEGEPEREPESEPERESDGFVVGESEDEPGDGAGPSPRFSHRKGLKSTYWFVIYLQKKIP